MGHIMQHTSCCLLGDEMRHLCTAAFGILGRLVFLMMYGNLSQCKHRHHFRTRMLTEPGAPLPAGGRPDNFILKVWPEKPPVSGP